MPVIFTEHRGYKKPLVANKKPSLQSWAFLLYNIFMPKDKENQKRLAKEWYERNKEIAKERARQWALDNPEKRYQIHRKNREKHLEKHNAANKLWNSKNKHVKAALQAKRKAAQLQRTPKWLTNTDLWIIEEAYHLAQLRTNLFNFPWHVDHIIPLQGKNVSGLHVPSNLRVISGSENVKKSNKYAN
jgi:muconolactone delta-isomerase